MDGRLISIDGTQPSPSETASHSFQAIALQDATTTSTESNIFVPDHDRRSPNKAFSVSEIYPWLYLGSDPFAESIDSSDPHNPLIDIEKTRNRLSERKITHIINCARRCINIERALKDSGYPLRGYNHYIMDDDLDQDILSNFEDFIRVLSEYHASASNAVILVHCEMGISRSPSMVMAYLVKTQRVTRKYAQRFLQTKRPETNPNPIFIAQVRKYHRTLFPEDYANTRKTTTDTMGRSPLASKPINALGGSQSMESICDGPQSLAIAMNELSISSASYAPQQANEGIETASPREKPLNENIESPIRRLLISDEQVQSGNEQSSRAVPLLLSIPKSRNSLKIQTANLSSKQP